MSKKKKQNKESLIGLLDSLIDHARKIEKEHAKDIARVHPKYRQSARNLIHYRALRSRDLRPLQKRLGNLELPRLSETESHVMASLLNTRSIVRSLKRGEPVKFKKSPVSIKTGDKLLRRNTKALLGYRSKGRRGRIMVTLPTDAAYNPVLVDELVAAGMNSARINCAHDNPTIWSAMIEHVRAAAKKHRRKVKICMDLAGPKIRTGPLRPGPKVVTFGPKRDPLGRVVGPAVVRLTTADRIDPDLSDVQLPVPEDWLNTLRPGDTIEYSDTRGKNRKLEVVHTSDKMVLTNAYLRAYIQTGTVLHRRGGDDPYASVEGAAVGELPPVEEKMLLNVGDVLILHKDVLDGEPAEYDAEGKLTKMAHISCRVPEVFERVKVGERVLLDDGKTVGIVKEAVTGHHLEIEVTYAKTGGQRLRSEKGINFPDSDLQISGLTAKDREDLEFVVENADVVNMSFVNGPADVKDLMRALDALGALNRIGIILKVESKRGYANLTEILLRAMRTYPVGVMIARGDLAVEVGWENIALVQQEIMALCLAAHVPDVWATQVLENLAKKGLPTRAELTDAASAQQAECVMLNKGTHIVRAIGLLDHILKHMKAYREKNTTLHPTLESPLATLDKEADRAADERLPEKDQDQETQMGELQAISPSS